MASEKYSNDASTTLNGAINNSVTSLVVTSATKFPTTGNFRIKIDSEYMLVTAVSGTTFTVTRGIEGSVAASHSNSVAVYHVLTKGSLDTILAENFQYGALASRPAAERAGRTYLGSDYPIMYRDNGSSWQGFYRNMAITPPVSGSYTWSHGGGTATNTDITNGPSTLDVVSTGAGDKISTFLRSYTAPASITALLVPALNVSISFCGVCISDGTKFSGLGLILDSGLSKIWTPNYNTKTSYSGAYFTYDPPIDYSSVWLRMTDDNTNFIYSLSPDGTTWVDIYSVSRTSHMATPSHMGVWLGTNAATGAPAKVVWVSDN
jgi:hypothetical protein